MHGDADPRQVCVAHAGCHHRGPLPLLGQASGYVRARYVPCRCRAYAWPHRPGGGLCRWPEPPLFRCTIPAGSHSWPRIRLRGSFGKAVREWRGH
jgi:hypothetical protein